MSSLNLWVKQEPFIVGNVPLSPHPKLTPKHLKRIVSYVKNKEGFPYLRYSVWKHIACHKLQLSEDLAHFYFDNYNLIHLKKARDRIDFDLKIAACKINADAELENARDEIQIDARRFALLLFLQYIQKEKLCSSFHQEEWSSQACKSPTFNKDQLELKQLNFVKNRLEEMIHILKDDAVHKDIPEDTVEPLGLIIEGSVDNNRTIQPVYELALMKENYKDAGYMKLTKTFKQNVLITWIKAHLSLSPFGLSACLTSGRRLRWCDRENASNEGLPPTPHKQNRIITNAPYAAKGKKLVSISQVYRQTVARASGILHGSTVKLNRCQQAYFYLLSPLRAVSIQHCHDCTLILGPVATTVEVFGCRNLKISVVTRRITLRDSCSITLFLLTPTWPLILGDKNTSISLASYNVTYPTLEKEMREAGLAEEPNLWDQPYSLSAEMKEESAGDLVMPAEEFVTCCVPFEMDGPTKDIPGGLPPVYADVLKKRQERVEAWHAKVKAAGLSKEQRQQLQTASQQKFQAWLAACGYQRELNSLSQYQKHLSLKSIK